MPTLTILTIAICVVAAIACAAVCAAFVVGSLILMLARLFRWLRRDPRADCPSLFLSDAQLAAEREYLAGVERPSPIARRGRIGARPRHLINHEGD